MPPSDLERDLIVRNGGHATNLARARSVALIYFNQYRSRRGQLDVWFIRGVLSVEQFRGKPQLIRYVPGHWERVLMQAAKVAA